MARYTAEELASVKQAIVDFARGERVASVTKNGRTVQYSAADLNELRELEREMATDVAFADPKRRRRSRTRMTTTSKGLG
ncbi:gpW family head-tail joining protein [Salinicola sp. CPA57]|uniref:gpW family head-tail joining protein n=1 Tax=Salinicola sp. CPA57 TaxID=1949080 RepID=UPI000DA1E38D|nr:gpW family head-tail joining protein [Salinicola sp. CPA57]